MIKLHEIYKNNVLNNFNYNFNNTGLYYITGKSGSGKTTLLNLIGLLDIPDKGNIIINNHDISKLNSNEKAMFINENIGFIFQDFNLIDNLNIKDNILLTTKKYNEKEFDELINSLDIKEIINKMPDEISGGEKQRVAIARAIIKNPKIILADEPTGNLDTENEKKIINILEKISENYLVIVVKHDINPKNKNTINLEKKDKYINTIIEKKNLINFNKNTNNVIPLNIKNKLLKNMVFNNKFKFMFSILSISISILMFVVLQTIATYDSNDNIIKLAQKYHTNYFEIDKLCKIKSIFKAYPEESDKFFLEKEYGLELYNIYKLNKDIYFNDIFDFDQKNTNFYYINPETKFVSSENNVIEEKIIGTYPINENEIIISNYFANYMIDNGICNKDGCFYPKNYNELINQNIILSKQFEVKITGIIDYEIKKYIKIKNYTNDDYIDDNKTVEVFHSFIKNEYNKIYVTPNFIKYINQNMQSNLKKNVFIKTKIDREEYIPFAKLNKEVRYYDGIEWKETTKMNSDEIILSIQSLSALTNNNNYINALNEYLKNYPENLWKSKEEEFLVKNFDINKYVGKQLQITIYSNVPTTNYINQNTNKKIYKNVKIIGVSAETLTSSDNDTFGYLSNNIIDIYVSDYAILDGFLSKDMNKFKQTLLEVSKNNEYQITTPYVPYVREYSNRINTFYNNFKIINYIILVLSIIIMINYFYSELNEFKKAIGILLSQGVSRKEIYKLHMFKLIILSILLIVINILLYAIISNSFIIPIFGNNPFIKNPFILNTKIIVLIISIVTITTFSIQIILLKIIFKKPIIDIIYDRSKYDRIK